MEILISNTEFGFYLRGKEINPYKYTELREKYDSFLNQPLTLGMFIPCKFVDGVCIVLEEPKEERKKASLAFYQQELKEYQEAKDRVLFEGFEKDNSFVTHKSHASFFYPISCLYEQTIECLVEYNLELTPTAQKQIGL